MDKGQQKEIAKDLKQKEQEHLVAILPMSEKQLKDFFDFLDDRLSDERSGNSLKLTETFCRDRNVDFDKVKEWANELGGYDDTEILWNCEEKYEFLIG